jgi:hypothetical protein
MIDNGVVFRQNPRVEYRDLAEEGGVLLHLDTASYHGINPVGAYVWKLCDEGATFPEIIAALRLELTDAPPSLESDIAEFLEDMAARELLVTQEP